MGGKGIWERKGDIMQYMKIRYGEPFSIPRRLGTELFKEVVRIKGVDYVKGKGFIVADYYALSSLNRILVKLGLILTPEVKCYLCNRPVDCDKCRFRNVCKKNTNYCICDQCLEKEDLADKYIEKQRMMLSSFINSLRR